MQISFNLHFLHDGLLLLKPLCLLNLFAIGSQIAYFLKNTVKHLVHPLPQALLPKYNNLFLNKLGYTIISLNTSQCLRKPHPCLHRRSSTLGKEWTANHSMQKIRQKPNQSCKKSWQERLTSTGINKSFSNMHCIHDLLLLKNYRPSSPASFMQVILLLIPWEGSPPHLKYSTWL